MERAVEENVRSELRAFMAKWLKDSVPTDELGQIEREGVSPSGLLAPFHDALVPGIRLLNERSFSTRLGNLHERIAVGVATPVHAEVRLAYDLSGSIPVLAREFITQRIAQLERREAQPDGMYEREQLLTASERRSDGANAGLRATRSGCRRGRRTPEAGGCARRAAGASRRDRRRPCPTEG